MLGVLPLLVFTATLLSTGCAQRSQHRFKLLTSQRVRSVDQCSDVAALFEYDFPSILKPRLPGTESHAEVREYIISRLEQLDCSRWNITQHTFEDDTPEGVRPFTNIIATLDPHVEKRLVLAAHYDSKYIYSSQGRHFLGATDSALPVALLLDMVLSLDAKLQERELTDYSLQLIFFDGEEAFKSWTATDSLYGSRQLAQDMDEQGGLLSVGDKTGLQAMEVFILLDLIGATNPYPAFHNTHSDTTNIFQRFVKIEKRLDSAKYLEKHTQNYFKEQTAFNRYNIEDDHKPFQQRGVPIVHLITTPFPRVWHSFDDNASAIDKTMVANFKLIMMVFLHEYFHLR